ncbi:mannosyltransferase [Infundibulicybe gibba]|nr:mannosyltransferase [Infundibulicybe gibba]
MSGHNRPLRVAFIHPDLGIGGAERLVVDAALGLQALGHHVDIYTSHHDPSHCFEETKNGSLNVHHIKPPFPRAVKGKFHILLAHARQLHLTGYLLSSRAPRYDVYFTRVVFYCHFPDKLLANGAFIDGNLKKKNTSLIKAIYRFPMDWLEEITTRQADIILANSKFTARVFKSYFTTINQKPRIVYPGINLSAYDAGIDPTDPDLHAIQSTRPTLISLNRFEKKKDAALAIKSFALLKDKLVNRPPLNKLRLVIAGGYDPRLEDNMLTLYSLIDLAKSHSLTFNVITPSSQNQVKIPPLNGMRPDPEILFLLNFTTSQRTALLHGRSTLALLYTPANEHFGIGPVEAMSCGVPVLACNSGGPTESIVDSPADQRTGWLVEPNEQMWAQTLVEIVSMSEADRMALSNRSKQRATSLFSMEAMASSIEDALKEVVGMGQVDSSFLVWVVMIFGFLLSYAIGPWVLAGLGWM